MSVLIEMKGDSTSEEVISAESRASSYPLPSGTTWSCLQNNNNNATYTSLPAGSTNNNNKNNSYVALPVAESIDKLAKCLEAEDNCFDNKRNRLDACKVHYHLTEIMPLVNGLENGYYKPSVSICFVLEYPTFREVFAAAYIDRMIHHLVAPYIQAVTEKVHTANGDVSHGNRKGHSAQTAAEQIQAKMKEYPDGILLGMDIQGFFMHIQRKLAWKIFCYFEERFRPEGYTNEEREWLMSLIHALLLIDPTANCERHSPIQSWENVRKDKSLFGNPHGLPIGNFYSQLIANLILAVVDMIMHMTHFVDDFAGVFDTIEEVREAKRKFDEATKSIYLTMHPKKIYIQPVRHGIKFCGRVIFTNRMYINNRTIHACNIKIDEYLRIAEPTIMDVRKLVACINSYTGLMSHLSEFNTQKKLTDRVLKSQYGEFLLVRAKYNHLVLNIVPECTARAQSEDRYDKLTKKQKQYDWRSS